MEKLKAEIFDIIYEQDVLKVKFEELEKVKREKLNKLKELQYGDKLPNES